MNLASLLDLPAMMSPEAIVLIDATDDGRVITYDDLRRNAAHVTGLLRRAGCRSGDRVGLFANNSARVVEVMFGAAALGTTLVPMNYRAARHEAAHLVKDSDCRFIFAQSRYSDMLRGIESYSSMTAWYLDSLEYAQACDATDLDLRVEEVNNSDVAVLLYTSGTTSLPKGVKLTHGALTDYVMTTNDAVSNIGNGRMLLSAPLYHVAGVTSLLNAIYSGRTTVLLAQFEAGAWLEAVATHEVTHSFLVPTMIARLLQHEQFQSTDLSSLRAVTYGAAPMSPAMARRMIDAFPAAVEFSQAYGLTETTSTVAVLGPEDHRLSGTASELETKVARLGSVGRPVADVEIRVQDEQGQPLPAGSVGEVLVRTSRSMSGYSGNEERTRVTIDEEGWVHTGDRGHLDEGGYLFLGGRSGDMIIHGGENVSPQEVERALTEHPDVLEAGVVGLPDETWGELVAAAVVLARGSTATPQSLADYCRTSLAPFKRPQRIVIVSALPQTSTGKVTRRQLLPFFDEAL